MRRIFSNINNISDFKKLIFEKFEQVSFVTTLVGKEQLFIDSCNSLENNEEKEEKFVSFLKQIDKDLDFYTSNRDPQYSRKITTALSGALYLDKYYDKTQLLSDDNLVLLSYFSSLGDDSLFSDYINTYDENLLTAIKNIDDDFCEQFDMLSMIDIFLSSNRLKKEEIANFVIGFKDYSIRDKRYKECADILMEAFDDSKRI